MDRIRVVVVDEYSLTRETLAAFVGAQRDMVVVAQVGADGCVLDACRDTFPHVAIVHLPRHVLSTLRVITNVARRCPHTRVLALSMYDDPIELRAVLAAGGAGYITRRVGAADLLDAVRELYAGRAYLRVSMDDDSFEQGDTSRRAAASQLSRREREVLNLLVEGYTNKEIAVRLNLQKKTIDTYRTRLQEKLGVRGRAALVRYALVHAPRAAAYHR